MSSWSHVLGPDGQASETYHEEGVFGYRVTANNNEVDDGTITVDDSATTRVRTIVIKENGSNFLEHPNITIRSNTTVRWVNDRNDTVTVLGDK